jgi:hypothetical protein
MKRKGWIRLLSIITAILLPVGAMVQGAAADLLKQAEADGKEVVSTVTFEPGALLMSNQIVADMSAATVLRFQKLPGGYGALIVALSGADVFTAQFRMEETGIYAMSEALGSQALYFTWEDLKNGLTDLLKSSGVDESIIQSLTEGLDQGLSTGTLTEDIDTASMSEAELRQKIVEAMGGDESLLSWLDAIEAKAIVTNGSFTLDGSDTADTQTEITITKEDLLALYQTSFVKNKIIEQLKAQDASLTDADAAAKADESLAELVKAMDTAEYETKVVKLTQGEDAFVAAQIDLTAKLPADEISLTDTTAAAAETDTQAAEMQAIAATVKITKKTLENGVQYAVTADATSEGAAVLSLAANLTKTDTACSGTLTVGESAAKPALELSMTADYQDPQNVSGKLEGTAYDGGSQYAFALTVGQQVTDTTVDTTIGLSTGDSLDAIAAAPDTALLGTLKVNTVVQADSGFFDSLAAATPQNSVEVLKLSEDDMTTFLGTLQTAYMTVIYNMYSNLPQSVATLLAQQSSQE